jgi:hypothetical protein
MIGMDRQAIHLESIAGKAATYYRENLAMANRNWYDAQA